MPLPETDITPAPVTDRDTAMVVQQALQQLAAEQRSALVLVDIQGYSVAEAAVILGVAEGTIKSRCARGRARLAVMLGHLRNPVGSGGVPSPNSAEERWGRSDQEGGRRMTTFSDADFDLLADFVGGALDGTPEADDVRRLVSTDEAWAEAYGALVTAEVAVRDRLTALGADPLPIPADVAHRLDTALQAAVNAPLPNAPVLDLARAREARRHRRQRWAIGLATAAAVLICGGFGVSLVAGEQAKNDTISSSTADGGNGEAAPQLAPSAASGGTGTSARADAAWWPPGRTTGRGRSGSWRRRRRRRPR